MIARSLLFLICLHVSTSAVRGEMILLTTAATESIGGISIRNGDIAQYNTTTNTATLVFSEELFENNETIDAFQYMSNGIFLLSTTNAATIGGVTFAADDIVSYDTGSGMAQIVFDGDNFSANENIDAFHRFDDGTWLISTTTNATLGGLTFRDGDLAHYNATTNMADLFFNEDVFSASEEVDGVYAVTPDILRLSTAGTASLGGTPFQDGDIIEYTISTGIATTIVDESVFAGPAEVNGISAIPEPQPSPTVGLAMLAVLAGWRRR